MGTTIPVPGIDTSIIQKDGCKQLFTSIVCTICFRGAFSNFTIFALGIGPYITASIIIQLLQAGFESLKELQKSGEGKRRLVSILEWRLCSCYYSGVRNNTGIVRSALKANSPFSIITVILTLVSCKAVWWLWLGDRITEKE